ncbi:MAG: hypothetical protein EON58_12080 [Alphaproteobacteria bacterium]|nr:MAG: hypothetical protein EON58_12080 [Alphaproteobacteria bacterium]
MIRIKIDTSNEAFQPNDPVGWRSETAWLLHDLADRIAAGRPLPLRLIDYNGNTVGDCECDDEDSQISAPAGE